MSSKLKESIILFFIQWILYGLVCVNMKAVALSHYNLAALSDFTIATFSFFVIKKIATGTADKLYQWIGYVLGSVAGSYTGVWLSIKLAQLL